MSKKTEAIKALERIQEYTIKQNELTVILDCVYKRDLKLIKKALEQLPKIQQEIDQWHEVANDNQENAMTCISNIEKILRSDR